MIWNRYDVMLEINAILFYFLFKNIDKTPPPDHLKIGIFPLLGIFFCIGWYSIHKSSRAYHDRWMELARRFHWANLKIESNPIAEIFDNRLKVQGLISW